MKILYVVNKPNVGGLQTSLRSRINALREKGIQGEVVFLGRGDGTYIFKNIPHDFASSASAFSKIIHNGKYDYISFIYTITYLDQIPKSFKGKVIYEVRGWNHQIADYIASFDRARKVDAVLCIAHYLKPLIVQQLKRKIPVFVEGNTVDPLFRYMAPPKRTWSDCPTPRKTHKIIGFVGRVERAKNWRACIQICEKLAQTEKIELWIICNPNTSRDLTEMVSVCKRMGLSDNIRVIAHVPNHHMPEVYSVIVDSGGCILSTSRREGLGNHILEPMACGLPVVSSNVPGKNEIIQHRRSGLLFSPSDMDRAVRYLKEIIGDRELRKTVIRGGLRTIRKEYNQVRYVERFLIILSNL
jgi:glycosyltransferase involved in cell wall biosynthesis